MFSVSDPLCKGKALEETDDWRSVKLEVEDPPEEECGPLHKRSKQYPQDSPKQWRIDSATVSSPNAAQYNPLDEPSPLGLRLRKSPSLLDLIQMKLSSHAANAAAASSCITDSEDLETRKKKDGKWITVSGTTDKLKASNFPGSILRIGTWERVSRYEGDLVAKCYFAKHKLVWEVLDGGLKSKIEIQWSDITALKASSCSENKPGTLDIVVARQPLFFKETNPQPRKHTLWQATTDFTGGQASIHKRHFLQFAPGILSKHFEKLIQCDKRLHLLSQQPNNVLESPYFEHRSSVFDDHEEAKGHVFDLISDYGPGFSGFRDVGSTCSASPTSSRSDAREPPGTRVQDSALIDAPSPSSVMDTRSIEDSTKCEPKEHKDAGSCWDQFKVAGLNSSMSMNDLVSHIGNCISGKISSTGGKEDEDTLNEITQYLLGDSHISAASDEKLLMSRVNSLCSLLQKDPVASVQTLQINKDDEAGGNNTNDENEHTIDRKPSINLTTPASQPTIPRIESLPQFLFNIFEDAEYKSG